MANRVRMRPWVPSAVLFSSFLDVFALLPTVSPYARSLGATTLTLAIVVGAYSLTNIPANVLGGMLVDRYGPRKVVLFGLVAAAVTVLTYSLAATPAALVSARLGHGIAGGVLMPAVFALASSHVAQGMHGRTFGRLGAVIGLAAVIAPASAGVIRQLYGFNAVFFAITGTFLLAACCTAMWVHDPRPASQIQQDADRAMQRNTAAVRELLRSGQMRRALAATVMLTMAAGVLATFLPDVANQQGASASTVGLLFTVYAFCAGVVMLSTVSRRIDVRGADTPIVAGLYVIATAFGGFHVVGTVSGLVLSAAIFGVGYGLVFPAVSAAISLEVGDGMRGRAFGLFNVAFSVGLAFGPVSIGWVTTRVVAAQPFIAAAAVLAIAAAVLLVVSRRQAYRPAGA